VKKRLRFIEPATLEELLSSYLGLETISGTNIAKTPGENASPSGVLIKK
jgi:hypothetical protein